MQQMCQGEQYSRLFDGFVQTHDGRSFTANAKLDRDARGTKRDRFRGLAHDPERGVLVSLAATQRVRGEIMLKQNLERDRASA
jgi:hypothetical protein